MSFFLKRFAYFDRMSFGRLYYKSDYVCDTMEGRDLFLEDRLPNAPSVIEKNKESWIAIPRGDYMVEKFFSSAYGEVLPVVTGCELFSNVCIIDSKTRTNGCIHVGVYDYKDRYLIDTKVMLDKIMGILETTKEETFLVR